MLDWCAIVWRNLGTLRRALIRLKTKEQHSRLEFHLAEFRHLNTNHFHFQKESIPATSSFPKHDKTSAYLQNKNLTCKRSLRWTDLRKQQIQQYWEFWPKKCEAASVWWWYEHYTSGTKQGMTVLLYQKKSILHHASLCSDIKEWWILYLLIH